MGLPQSLLALFISGQSTLNFKIMAHWVSKHLNNQVVGQGPEGPKQTKWSICSEQVFNRLMSMENWMATQTTAPLPAGRQEATRGPVQGPGRTIRA